MNSDAQNNNLHLYKLTQAKIDAIICGDNAGQLTYKGVNCTPIIRSTILACLEQILLLDSKLKDLPEQLLKQLLLRAMDIVSKPTPPTMNSGGVLCVGDANGFSSIGGVVFNRYFDPIRDSFHRANIETSLLTFGCSQYDNKQYAIFLDRGFSLNRYIHYALAKNPLLHKLPKPLSQEIEIFLSKALPQTIKSEQGVIYKYICRNILDTLACKEMFIEILSHNKPRIIISTNYYTATGWGLVLAAKAQDIPYVELQHGVQGAGHHAFNYPLPLTQKCDSVPARYLVWSASEQLNIKNNGHQGQVLGPTWFHLFNLILNSTATSKEIITAREEIKSLEENALKWLAKSKSARHLFFIEQGSNVKYKYEQLRAALPDDISLSLIKRPGITTTSSLVSGRLTEKALPANAPLPLQLCFADGVVSGFSSSAIEASLLGRQVFFFSEAGKFFFEFEGVISQQFEDDMDFTSSNYIDTHLIAHRQKGLEVLKKPLESLPNPAEIILNF